MIKKALLKIEEPRYNSVQIKKFVRHCGETKSEKEEENEKEKEKENENKNCWSRASSCSVSLAQETRILHSSESK